jgi:hypothetical protein
VLTEDPSQPKPKDRAKAPSEKPTGSAPSEAPSNGRSDNPTTSGLVQASSTGRSDNRTGNEGVLPQESADISPELATGVLETDQAPEIFSNRLAVAFEVGPVDSSRRDRQLEGLEHDERSFVILLQWSWACSGRTQSPQQAIRRGRELLDVDDLDGVDLVHSWLSTPHQCRRHAVEHQLSRRGIAC